MQSNPPVSEFSLQPQPQPQLLIRSRLRPSPASSFSRSLCGPNEILVNVMPINPAMLGSAVNAGEGNIRADIDACLQAVEVAYANRRNKEQQNFIPTLQHSRLHEEAIHRIDGAIVMDYVNAVYRDYRIRNRFGDFDPNALRGRQVLAQQRAQGSEGVMNAEKRGSSCNRPKQFLNVTQQSKVARRDASFSSQKREGITVLDSKRQHRHTLTSHQSPVHFQPSTMRAPFSSIKKSEWTGKAREDMRYCVSCEKPILSINVDFHQQYECTGFEQLYRMSFKELGELVEGKAKRMRQELRGMLARLRERGDAQSRAEVIMQGLVQLMSDYASEERIEVMQLKDEIREEQRRLKYNLFRESQNNLYAQAIDLTHKLHWFQEIAQRLRREQELTHESTTKTEEGKALQYIRTMATPTARAMKSEQSPINYFHPHLHRSRPS